MRVSNTSNRLKEIMAERKLRQVDILELVRPLTKKYGVRLEKNDLSQYVSGKVVPNQNKLSILAEALGVSEVWLMGYETSNSMPNNIIQLNHAKQLPILGSVACGTPTFADENLEGYFISDKIIRADFCLYAKGDSMIDIDIDDGDLVFVKQTPDVDNGKVAVVLIGEDATLKRVYKRDTNLILQAENKNYSPLIYSQAECETENIKILGEMVGVYKSINQ